MCNLYSINILHFWSVSLTLKNDAFCAILQQLSGNLKLLVSHPVKGVSSAAGSDRSSNRSTHSSSQLSSPHLQPQNQNPIYTEIMAATGFRVGEQKCIILRKVCLHPVHGDPLGSNREVAGCYIETWLLGSNEWLQKPLQKLQVRVRYNYRARFLHLGFDCREGSLHKIHLPPPMCLLAETWWVIWDECFRWNGLWRRWPPYLHLCY